MITTVVGPPGNGKGIQCMEFIEFYRTTMPHRPLFTNIELLDGCPYKDEVFRIDDIENRWPVYRGTPAMDGKSASEDYLAFWHYCPPGSVIIIDEADLYFDCTDHSKVGKDIHRFLKQHRKLGLELIFVVQCVENLYVRIRRLTQRWVLTEWTWRSRRFWQWASNWIGIEAAQRMTTWVRAEFATASMEGKDWQGQVNLPHEHVKAKYWDAEPWYATDQLLGDISHLRWLNEQASVDGEDFGAVDRAWKSFIEWMRVRGGDAPALGDAVESRYQEYLMEAGLVGPRDESGKFERPRTERLLCGV